MKTKIEIKSIFGELLFSYEKEENTLKSTLEEAIKAGVTLRYANLRYANLCNAKLTSATLTSVIGAVFNRVQMCYSLLQ